MVPANFEMPFLGAAISSLGNLMKFPLACNQFYLECCQVGRSERDFSLLLESTVQASATWNYSNAISHSTVFHRGDIYNRSACIGNVPCGLNHDVMDPLTSLQCSSLVK